jgi:hypothetical protein
MMAVAVAAVAAVAVAVAVAAAAAAAVFHCTSRIQPLTWNTQVLTQSRYPLLLRIRALSFPDLIAWKTNMRHRSVDSCSVLLAEAAAENQTLHQNDG